MQLRTYVAPGKPARRTARAITIEPGSINVNDQLVVRKAGRAADDLPGQMIYVLHCNRCGYDYGESGIRVHQRRCPRCSDGTPGVPVPEPEPGLFG